MLDKKLHDNKLKIATAIGKMQSTGVQVIAPDVNNSTYTFSPDVEDNAIRYGLSGITRIGEDLIKDIIANRPYTSMSDFLQKIKVSKPQMINLIKAGAFDGFGDRVDIMHKYVDLVSDTKKRITLQNMKMLIDFGLIPDTYDMERRVFNFNKYLKKQKIGDYYGMDSISFTFYGSNFEVDDLVSTEETESGFKIKQTVWDKIYKSYMDNIRPWVKEHHDELLDAVNDRLTSDTWNKYALGTVSKWEMDALSCYMHEHELANVNNDYYRFADFNDLNEHPRIERMVPIKGKTIPIFKLERIAGTVLDRDKAKKIVTLLTTTGVVTIKVYGNRFANYDKQISERGRDGVKHVLRKSEFSRGNKIIVTGMREDDAFIAKKYKNTPYHTIETIEEVKEDGTIIVYSRNDE